ncbi:MAG TPA: DUF1992 domain-containing protein [Pirellulaceae bacterium]|jgi:hypothetical protein
MSDLLQPPNTTKKIRSWDFLAEQRIQAAQAAGQFENLSGFGKPIPGIDEPHDELWWVKDKLKREQLSSLPPALAIRLDVQNTLANLKNLTTETEVRRQLAALNDRIRKAAFAITWGPSVDVLPLSGDEIEGHVARWYESR